MVVTQHFKPPTELSIGLYLRRYKLKASLAPSVESLYPESEEERVTKTKLIEKPIGLQSYRNYGLLELVTRSSYAKIYWSD